MFSLFKKKEIAHVIALDLVVKSDDLIPILFRYKVYIMNKYGVDLKHVMFADENNKDIIGNIDKFKSINISQISLLTITANENMDKENEVMITINNNDYSLTVVIMINKKYPINFYEISSIIASESHINYGFLYEVIIGRETPGSYLFNYQESRNNVIGVPAFRLSKKIMSCFMKHQDEMYKGKLKDIFKANLITDLHLKSFADTAFLQFIKENLEIKPVYNGAYLIEIFQDNLLDTVREKAYQEKIVLCS